MEKLKPADLMSLEDYAKVRNEFRKQVMAHKKKRLVHLGENITIYFEDRLIMQYQVQEMLRAEKIFEVDGIQEELDTYNPLIPDGSNWKAVMMIEFPDPEERKEKLKDLRGIDQQIRIQIGDDMKVYAITNEDLPRENEEKTSAVHFMRFELSADMVAALRQNESLRIGCEHKKYLAEKLIDGTVRDSLIADLN